MGSLTPLIAKQVIREESKYKKKNRIVRAAGGEVWEDETLASWPKGTLVS